MAEGADDMALVGQPLNTRSFTITALIGR